MESTTIWKRYKPGLDAIPGRSLQDKAHRYRARRLSLQYHHHRSEHWVVVRGTALAKVGDEERFIHEVKHLHPKHPASPVKPGQIPLEIIEVQNGEYGRRRHREVTDDFNRTNPRGLYFCVS